MGCPFHDGGGESHDGTDGSATGDGDADRAGRWDDRGLDRRAFVKSALAIGGASAVQGLEDVAGIAATARAAEGDERITPGARQNRQHAWDAFEAVAATGNTAQPPHSLLLFLDYEGGGAPNPEHRRRVETALGEIERHFEWHAEGVLFTIGYTGAYFDRFDADPPAGADPTPPDEVVDYAEALTGDEGIEPETHDAVLLLASANVANLLTVESALWGEAVDVEFEATFEGVFDRPSDWPDRMWGLAVELLPPADDAYVRSDRNGVSVDARTDPREHLRLLAGL
jgi:hypothetical protein